MLGLFVSLALLGLSAVDPVGIGIMPVLLVQEHPYRRSLVFLSGSFVSLLVMGLLFAKGLGRIVLRFEHGNAWFVPTVEAISGAILLVVALTVYIHLKGGKTAVEPSEKTLKWLQLGSWQLFGVGAVLVALQSVIDVVFVIAMVRVGQVRLSGVMLVIAIATYALTALVFQVAVVAAFRFAPAKQKAKTLNTVHTLLLKYSDRALIAISLLLGLTLLALAFVL